VRIWVDLTNSPHVLVLRPLIQIMRDEGHEVEVTARDFAQTLDLLDRFGIEHTAIGSHRGSRLAAKAAGLASRSLALLRWARGRSFDLALGHGSNDVNVAAAALRIPSVTAFDYEWARVQHHVNCRLAAAVVVPEAIPPSRLDRYGAHGKLRRYPGLKEEYYLADFEPDPSVLGELGLDADRPIALVRTPPDVSLYHRFENAVFRDALERLREVQTVVLPRTRGQRAEAAGARIHRAAPRRGRPEPGGLRRRRDLRGRYDEPRGRRARYARVHDLRGAARCGRRAAALAGAAAEAVESVRAAGREARRGCGGAGPPRPSRPCDTRAFRPRLINLPCRA
jgi:predicted glycosyltransferase